jgi:preprotein translocase subunit SecG
MLSLIVAVHVIVCVAICIVILLQQGKGADIGAVFGGSSQTVFGASGAGNALTKTTWALAAVFCATSMILAYASTQRAAGSIFSGPFSSAPRSVMPATRAPAKVPVPAAPAAPGAPAAPAPHK